MAIPGVSGFFWQLHEELLFYLEKMAVVIGPDTIKDFEVGEVLDGLNSYEKTLHVTLTQTVSEDHSAPNDAPMIRTKMIALKTYQAPYGDNNAAVFLRDQFSMEHELIGLRIPCPGGEPIMCRDGDDSPSYCAELVVGYLVHGDAPWK